MSHTVCQSNTLAGGRLMHAPFQAAYSSIRDGSPGLYERIAIPACDHTRKVNGLSTPGCGPHRQLDFRRGLRWVTYCGVAWL